MGAREMLEAVNKEFQGCGMELGGAAGELISTSGKWSSNVQRDMLRRCKTAKVPFMHKCRCTCESLGVFLCKLVCYKVCCIRGSCYQVAGPCDLKACADEAVPYLYDVL